MRLLAPENAAVVYVISCELGLTKIGVAVDAPERRRALQVGSPVLPGLGGCYRFATARAAYAVVADVQRQRGDRWERGGWYRVSAQEVAAAIESRGPPGGGGRGRPGGRRRGGPPARGAGWASAPRSCAAAP